MLGNIFHPFQDLIPRSVTWVNRLDSYISPKDDHYKDEGHQLNESKIAIKNGGILGKGPGKGIQRHFLYADHLILYMLLLLNNMEY